VLETGRWLARNALGRWTLQQTKGLVSITTDALVLPGGLRMCDDGGQWCADT
jgi:hypothetical protein